jgi:hypothetical protein
MLEGVDLDSRNREEKRDKEQMAVLETTLPSIMVPKTTFKVEEDYYYYRRQPRFQLVRERGILPALKGRY